MNHTMHALQELKCLGFGKRIIMPDLDSLEENCFLFPQRVVEREMNASKVKYFASSFEEHFDFKVECFASAAKDATTKRLAFFTEGEGMQRRKNTLPRR